MAKSVFETLNGLDLGKHIKILQRQKYISWSDAWYEVKKIYPATEYKVSEDASGNPFFVSSLGIFVKVSVSIEGLTHTINHPVMNGANKAMKAESYSYKVKEYVQGKPTGKMVDKFVEPATSFDVNSTIMRGLAKGLALHGLALYVFRDEAMPDMPTVDSHQLQMIVDKIKEKGMTLSQVTKSWQIEKIAQLQESNFENMMMWLEGNK